ncbi:HAD family hydrolase [Serinicoccus kebangsaanensis]|uniref:HAD family hydrolase n=1 Tax=Serinicoccus kebangsaanensis TaxID=2602069 RepID=UPI00124ED4FE|nr:HAD family hydrolase [Serinicoccus kebangsaanensis]
MPDLTDRLPLGARVVVRHLIEGGDRATDTLGQLVERTETEVVVRTRSGETRVPVADVVAAKPVPERPWRLAAFLRRAGVAVLDLDGVLRDFGTDGQRSRSERELGLEPMGLPEIAFALPQAAAMVTGRGTYAEWIDAMRAHLLELGHTDTLVSTVMERWSADRGAPIHRTVALVDDLTAAGIPTYVFTNGTDRVPDELAQIGLGHLAPMLLNAHDLGFAKPAPEAYAVAHAEIERRLGRTVGRAEVRFTDDRVANVEAARDFGWHGQVFTLPVDD